MIRVPPWSLPSSGGGGEQEPRVSVVNVTGLRVMVGPGPLKRLMGCTGGSGAGGVEDGKAAHVGVGPDGAPGSSRGRPVHGVPGRATRPPGSRGSDPRSGELEAGGTAVPGGPAG